MLTDTPPSSTPTLSVVFGALGNGIASIFNDKLCDGSDRARPSEITPRMPARALRQHAEAAAADRNVGHSTQIVSFQRHDRSDIRVCCHDLLDATQIAETLFADVARHQDIDAECLAQQTSADSPA